MYDWANYGSIFKEFAQSIGYDSGDIVSMWINGSSTSYNGKLHEISAKYGVSVAWIRGETGEKNPAPKRDGIKEYMIKGLSIQSGKLKNPGSKRPGALYIYCTVGINPVARSFRSNPPPR